MQWRLSKYIVDTTVDYLRRVFTYNQSWQNDDIRLVTFPSGSQQLVFEQFFEENERYPVITVNGSGGMYSNAAINSIVRTVTDDFAPLGVNALSYVTLTNTTTFGQQIPASALTQGFRGLQLSYAWTGQFNGGDTITATLYSNYTTAPTVVASASLPGSLDTGFTMGYAEFFPTGSLGGFDYYVTLQVSTGSTYYLAVDPVVQLRYQYNTTGGGAAYYSGSVVGNWVLPVFYRLGGNFEPNITIRCMAKNQTADAYNLAELSAQYLMLAKHAQINRTSAASNGMTLGTAPGTALTNFVGELTAKGIYIRTVQQGGVEVRKRGDNDNIFVIPISVSLFTEWHQDFAELALLNIEQTVTEFYDPTITIP
jgi:hypothetical protein